MRSATSAGVLSPGAHVAHFYDDAAFPAADIARHLATGLNTGCPALVIATPAHSAAIACALGTGALEVTWLDANEALSTFLATGESEAERFEHAVGELVRATASDGRRVYAYGELVDLLAERGRVDTAFHVEDLWNALAQDCVLELLCGYSVATLGRSSDPGALEGICERHTRVGPEGLVDAMKEAQPQQHVAAERAQHQEPQRGQPLHERRPSLGEPFARLSEERRLRDELIGIASHELRNPVHVVGLNLRAAVTAIDQGASVASVRMRLKSAESHVQRLGALLDRMLKTSGLLAGETNFEPAEFDLAEAVTSVLNGMSKRLASSNITIELQSVVGRWDRKRVEQIIEHLISHAITFSGAQPIRVSLQGFPDFVCLSLCDWGLDDRDAPVQPAGSQQQRDPSTSDFGLWTARQLAEAMSGSISTARPGVNRFRVILTLPRVAELSAIRSA